jgi:hypothetical protein
LLGALFPAERPESRAAPAGKYYGMKVRRHSQFSIADCRFSIADSR